MTQAELVARAAQAFVAATVGEPVEVCMDDWLQRAVPDDEYLACADARWRWTELKNAALEIAAPCIRDIMRRRDRLCRADGCENPLRHYQERFCSQRCKGGLKKRARKLMPRVEREAIAEMYREGAHIDEVCRRFDRARQTIYDALKREGVKRRPVRRGPAPKPWDGRTCKQCGAPLNRKQRTYCSQSCVVKGRGR